MSSTPALATTVHVNEVRLVGRLAAEPVLRVMPSGDRMLAFRLVVDRSGKQSPTGRRAPTVDTLECAAWRGDVQRALARVVAGDVLEVSGALRRRFWRSPGGPASRSEVEVVRARRVKPVSG